MSVLTFLFWWVALSVPIGIVVGRYLKWRGGDIKHKPSQPEAPDSTSGVQT